jgi:copper(I)-binding protein
MVMEGETMKMRQTDALLVKANSTLELKRKSYHLMFIDLLKPLNEGEFKTLIFTFDNGDVLKEKVKIQRLD